MSKHEHFEMERVLGDIQRVYSFGHGMTATLSSDKKRLNFSNILEQLDYWSRRGVEYFNVILPLATADKRLVMPDFFFEHWNDRSIYMTRNYKPPEMKFSKRWNWYPFNIFNPAVRESCRRVAAAYAEALKKYNIMYIFNWEDYGPGVAGRTAGYGGLDRKEFQKYLKSKYGTIERLNGTLKTNYASFDEIKQPIDKRSLLGNTVPRGAIPACRPLGYEFEKWILEVHVDYCKGIYREVKSRVPDAVVIADHNSVFHQAVYDPMTVFEYADLVGCHSYPYQTDIFRSLARYAPNKYLGVYEKQEMMRDDVRRAVHRPGEERLWRRLTIKNLGQLADRDHVFQSWWLSYTRGAFILTYGSGNWANPAYDLSTFRYYITGLPTGIRMVRRFEDVLLNTRKAPSKIVMLVPTTSMLHQYFSGMSKWEMQGVHYLLYPRNYAFESVTERLLLDGKADLAQYEVLIAPFASYFPRGLWEIVRPWIEKGGTLVCLGPCGLFDEFGFEYPDCPVKALIKKEFPPRVLNGNAYAFPTDWEWDNGAPISERALGSGRIVMTTRPILSLAADNRSLERFLKAFEGTKRRAWSPDTPVELTLRTDGRGKYFLFALNTGGDATLRGHIEVLGAFKGVKDLGIAGGFPVESEWNEQTGFTRFAFRLAPGAFTMFSLGTRGK